MITISSDPENSKTIFEDFLANMKKIFSEID